MTDAEFLLALKEYIEDTALTIEWEFGACQSLEKLIADGEMPDVYLEVMRRINEQS